MVYNSLALLDPSLNLNEKRRPLRLPVWKNLGEFTVAIAPLAVAHFHRVDLSVTLFSFIHTDILVPFVPHESLVSFL